MGWRVYVRGGDQLLYHSRLGSAHRRRSREQSVSFIMSKISAAADVDYQTR
jgi:hypothetical protein